MRKYIKSYSNIITVNLNYSINHFYPIPMLITAVIKIIVERKKRRKEEKKRRKEKRKKKRSKRKKKKENDWVIIIRWLNSTVQQGRKEGPQQQKLL